MTLDDQQRTFCYEVPANQVIKSSIWFILHSWRGISTLSSLFEEYPPQREHLNNGFIKEGLPIFSVSSFTSDIQLFHKDTRRLQSNGAERNVEFVLAPQHRTSGDPETTTKEDFDYGEESNMGVFRWIHDKSHETKMETRRRIRTLTLVEHCHVHLSVVL